MTIRDRSLGSGWLEPESAANTDYQPEYPYNKVTETESGHIMEFDDTPGRERIRLEHRTGTFIEMHPNGDEVHKVYGNGFEITVKDKNVLISGHCSITVEQDCMLYVKGDMDHRVDGDYRMYVKGKTDWVTDGGVTFLTKGDMKIGSGGEGITGSGALSLYSNDDMYLGGSVRVEGDLTADMLTSATSVDALLGMTAGRLGFVTITGGVSAGIPMAVPGNVLASAKVSAPLGNFGLMKAIMMTDTINKALYSSHIHKCPDGVTSTPISKMI